MLHTLFTCQPDATAPAQNEMQSAVRWLAPGIGLCALEFEKTARAFAQKPPVFVRHICPAQPVALAGGEVENTQTLERAVCALGRVGAPYSVQCRFLQNAAPLPRDIAQALAAAIGGQVEVRAPQKIYSVLVGAKEAHIGLSDGHKNLSAWAGGAHRFAREEGQISRAEFKLLEAFDAFGLHLPGGRALDLGAAPGGWTRVLLARGFEVTAVDPAQLDERFSNDGRVTHVRQLTQAYLPHAPRFDLVANDMRMDALQSARLMLEAARCLDAGGLAVMTLKLPQNAMQRTANQALDLLRQGYAVVHARQLFHNRSEVTVVLERRG